MHRRFDKYDCAGAYHWVECDRRSPVFNPPLLARYQAVLRHNPCGGRVLDVGCGDGYLLRRLEEKAGSVVGVDSEPTAVQLARQMIGNECNVGLMLGEGGALPFASRVFDGVVLADVFEHLETPRDCLAETRRVLRPNGWLVVTTPKWRPDRMWDQRHVREYTPEALRDLLEGYFARVEMRYFWPLFWCGVYRTRVGWRLLRWWARHGSNPFDREGSTSQRYGQILAICKQPIRRVVY